MQTIPVNSSSTGILAGNSLSVRAVIIKYPLNATHNYLL